MDDLDRTPGEDLTAEGDVPAGRPASVRGRGWEIMLGGEENAYALGGSDPFGLGEAEPPEDIAAPAPTAAPADATPVRPAAASVPDPISPGVSVEVFDEDEGEDSVYFEPVEDEFPPAPAESSARPGAPEIDVTTIPPSGDDVDAPEPEEPLVVDDEAGEPPLLGLPDDVGEEMEEPTPVIITPEPPVAAEPQALIRPEDPFEAITKEASTTSGPDEMAPSEELETLLVTTSRVNALWDEINETYDLVVADVRGDFRATDQSISDLKRARELLLAGYEHYDNAEEMVKRVKARLRLEEKVRQWGRTRGTWLAVYLIVWLLLLAIGSLFTNAIAQQAALYVPDWMAATFLPGLYGGLGGVIGALWVLIKHIGKKRDFDPIHTPWYITNPFMGMALGVVTYFLVRAANTLLTSDPVLTGELATPGLYILCIIVGFNQNVLWSMLDRLIKGVLPDDGDSTDRYNDAGT